MNLKLTKTKGFPKHCFFWLNLCEQAKRFTLYERLLQVRYGLPEFITNIAAILKWSFKDSY